MRSTKEVNYRNINMITIDGVEVDQGSLWTLKNDKLILVDDDQHVETEFKNNLFKEV